MSEEYHSSRVFYVKPGCAFSISEMYELVCDVLADCLQIECLRQTVTIQFKGARISITRDDEPYVAEDAIYWAQRVEGLESDGSTVCFHVSGFDPDLLLCVEPSTLSEAVWKTGKFTIMDNWSDKALTYE